MVEASFACPLLQSITFMSRKPTLSLSIVALIFAIIGLFALRSHTKSKGDIFSHPSMSESLSLNKQVYHNANTDDSEKRQGKESRQVVGERSMGPYLFSFTLLSLSIVSLIVYIFWEETPQNPHKQQDREESAQRKVTINMKNQQTLGDPQKIKNSPITNESTTMKKTGLQTQHNQQNSKESAQREITVNMKNQRTLRNPQKTKNSQILHESQPEDFKFVRRSWFNQSEEPSQEESSHQESSQPLMNLGRAPLSKIKAAIVPHAGLMYSGSVVANTFEKVDWTQFDTFLLLSTCHYARGNYQLPDTRKELRIPYREGSVEILHIPELNFSQNNEIMQGEHSWQVLLWFTDEINDYLKADGQQPLKIIPLLIGKELSEQELAIIENYLREHPRTFLCANTDLLHRPGTNRKDIGTWQKFDETTIQQIKEAVTKGKALDRTREASEKEEPTKEKHTMCGFFAVQALTQIANNLGLIPLDDGQYANSFQASKRKTGQYVGYLGMTFEEIPTKDIPIKDIPAKVLADNKDVLEETRETYQKGKRIPKEKLDKKIQKIAMPYKQDNDQLIYGIFVTIEKGKGKELRGCRGNYNASKHGLHYWVARQTLDSALNDYRFSPVTQDELQHLSFKISVLEPPILIYKRDRGNSPTPLEAFEKEYKYKERDYGIAITFKDRGAAFYLPSVLQEEMQEQEGSLKNMFNSIVTGLRVKSNPRLPRNQDYTLEIAEMKLYPTKVI